MELKNNMKTKTKPKHFKIFLKVLRNQQNYQKKSGTHASLKDREHDEELHLVLLMLLFIY